jgi:hypothetical protein
MKTRIILLLFLGFLFILNSCKKPEELPTYYIPQEFKDYVVFPVGSYWVYKDSVSGVLDTVTLQEQTFSITEIDLGYKEERLSQTYYYSIKDTLYMAISEFDEFGQIFQYRDYWNFFFVYANIGYTSWNDISVVSYSDSMTVNGVPYLDVYCISRPSLGTKYYYYWSDEIGLIKKTDIASVWELVNYNVN